MGSDFAFMGRQKRITIRTKQYKSSSISYPFAEPKIIGTKITFIHCDCQKPAYIKRRIK